MPQNSSLLKSLPFFKVVKYFMLAEFLINHNLAELRILKRKLYSAILLFLFIGAELKKSTIGEIVR